MKQPVCQACGMPIDINEPIIQVRYGYLGITAHPHLKVNRLERTDYFHDYSGITPTCIPAFRTKTS